MQIISQFCFVSLILSTFACGGQKHKTHKPIAPAIDVDVDEQELAMEPVRITVLQSGKVDIADARGIFDRANEDIADGNYAEAVRLLDTLVVDFPDSALVPAALYNSGLACEGMGRVDEAITRYLRLGNVEGNTDDAIDGKIRAAALYAEHDRWNQSIEVLDNLLADNLSHDNRLEVLARRGYVLLQTKDYAAAEAALTAAVDFHRKQSPRKEFSTDYFYAMAHFYLADIPRRQFEAIPLRLPDAQMQRDIEAKAVLVLLAEERFGDTLQLGNTYWASAAGYQMATIYDEFWRSLVSAPVPPQLSELAAKIYVEELHKKAMLFLQKALNIHRKNIRFTALRKSQTTWSQASTRQVDILTEILSREQAGDLLTANEAKQEPVLTAPISRDEYLPSRVDL